MASARIIVGAIVMVGFSIVLKMSNALPAPDSAGIVKMINGLAYGGIPYGSVSGMLTNPIPQNRETYYTHNDIQQGSILVPNARTVSQDVFQVIGSANSIAY